MGIKVKVGSYDVLDTGTIVLSENLPIELILNEATGFIMKFVFVNDKSVQETKVTADALGKGVVFRVVNANSPAYGTNKTLKIGTYNGRELYMSWRLNTLSDECRIFHYTLLLGKNVQK